MIKEEDLRKLIQLRDAKIQAEEKYKAYYKTICEALHTQISRDPLQVEIDGKEYEFIYSEYRQCLIFRPKMRKGGNCYGTATANGTNKKRPVYKKTKHTFNNQSKIKL